MSFNSDPESVVDDDLSEITINVLHNAMTNAGLNDSYLVSQNNIVNDRLLYLEKAVCYLQNETYGYQTQIELMEKR